MIPITKLRKCNRKYKTKGGHMRTVHDTHNKAKKICNRKYKTKGGHMRTVHDTD